MQNTNMREKTNFKLVSDVLFVLFCFGIVIGIIILGGWILNTYFGVPWIS